MQKKLITLAIAGALAVPGAAMADVNAASGSDITIYGKFHASWDVVDNGATFDGSTQAVTAQAGGDDSDDNTAVFRNARLGFKGAEDVGGGMKAIWQVETDLKTGNSNDTAGNMELRNTFVGLQGDNWGTVFMGKHDTPYKTATAKLDIFTDTIADYNNIIGSHLNGRTGFTNTATTSVAGVPYARQQTFNARPNQVVAYETPNFSGFKAQVARASIQNNEVNSTENLDAWSAMGMYDQGPFFASLAYEVYSGGASAAAAATTAGKEKIDAWKLGFGYTFGDTKLGFVYEDIEHDDNSVVIAGVGTTDGQRMSRDAFWLGASHEFGANVLKVAYGKADDSDDNNNDGADNWSIGIDHNFSKRTKVYAIYTDMDNDANANYALNSEDGASTYAPGLTSTANNVGGDVKAFSVGIVHSF